MYITWKAIAKPGAECIYSDTDSIMVSKDDIDMDARFALNGKNVKVIGEEMGQLEQEAIFKSFEFCVIRLISLKITEWT